MEEKQREQGSFHTTSGSQKTLFYLNSLLGLTNVIAPCNSGEHRSSKPWSTWKQVSQTSEIEGKMKRKKITSKGAQIKKRLPHLFLGASKGFINISWFGQTIKTK